MLGCFSKVDLQKSCLEVLGCCTAKGCSPWQGSLWKGIPAGPPLLKLSAKKVMMWLLRSCNWSPLPLACLALGILKQIDLRHLYKIYYVQPMKSEWIQRCTNFIVKWPWSIIMSYVTLEFSASRRLVLQKWPLGVWTGLGSTTGRRNALPHGIALGCAWQRRWIQAIHT